MADGCNWGPKVLEAATRACDTFVDYLHHALTKFVETKQAKALLIAAIQAAHERIFEGKVDQDGHWWDVGQTTLVGGIIVPIDKGNDRWSPSYEFLCVSVGDCKAFVYTNGQMQDVTDGAMRKLVADARDSGGRLGPATDVPESDILQLADLGNLALFSVPCEEGDLVLLLTDGVHDNLDPQHLGKKPRDMPKSMNLEAVDDWADVSPDKAEAAKNIFRIAFLEKQVEGAATPDELCSTLLDHCVKTTSASRKYMCENQGRIVPKDFVAYPGKMDHSTCAAITVSARYPALVEKPAPAAQADDDNDMLNMDD
jgi:serine/threonine protein phosphatase PrpC